MPSIVIELSVKHFPNIDHRVELMKLLEKVSPSNKSCVLSRKMDPILCRKAFPLKLGQTTIEHSLSLAMMSEIRFPT